MPWSDKEFDNFVTAFEVSNALANAAIEFLRRIEPNLYDDIPAVRDLRREFKLLHEKYVVPRRDLPADTTEVKTIPNLRIVR